MPLPIVEWNASLSQMQEALDATLAALDRYQAGWNDLLADRTGTEPPNRDAVGGQLEDRLREWDSRLAAAAELAASVERELNDREVVVGQWQSQFTAWRDGIERGVEPRSPA